MRGPAVAVRRAADPGAAVPHAGPYRRVDAALYGTTGVGGDLYVAAQDAVRAMVEHLGGELRALARGRVPARSLCVDLRIWEIVDAGQYIVSALLPRRSSPTRRLAV